MRRNTKQGYRENYKIDIVSNGTVVEYRIRDFCSLMAEPCVTTRVLKYAYLAHLRTLCIALGTAKPSLIVSQGLLTISRSDIPAGDYSLTIEIPFNCLSSFAGACTGLPLNWGGDPLQWNAVQLIWE